MNREKYELLDRERRLKYAAKEGSFWCARLDVHTRQGWKTCCMVALSMVGRC